ncbi:MAG: metallophosphoesterase [Myxococcota bacterium]|nr:metallophosphoesterase [Myxococcota bacterium]
MKIPFSSVDPAGMAGICLIAVYVTVGGSCASTSFFGKQETIRIEDGAVVLPKGPYQLYLAPGEVLIGAELPTGHSATLSYWKEGAPTETTAVSFKPAWDRISYIHLIGLEPGSPYQFKVSVGDQSTRVFPLITGVKGDDPFTFHVIGDSKEGCKEAHCKLVGLMTERPASLYVHLGDYVRHGDWVNDWNMFFELHRPLMDRVPILPVAGNHDVSAAGLYTGLFLMQQRGPDLRRYYSTRFGNTLFIILDTTSPIVVGDNQHRFLQAALEQSKSKEIEHVFIMLHDPIYSSGRHGSSKGLANSVKPLIENYSVTAVIAGHDHHYERTKQIKGIVHIVSGGGGAPFGNLDQKAFCEKAVIAFHFLEVEVNGSKVRLKAINQRGEIIDEVQLK